MEMTPIRPRPTEWDQTEREPVEPEKATPSRNGKRSRSFREEVNGFRRAMDDGVLATIPTVSARLVFLWCYRWVSRGGSVFVPPTKVAADCGMARSTAQEAIQVLVTAGHLTLSKRGAGKRANRYRLKMP